MRAAIPVSAAAILVFAVFPLSAAETASEGGIVLPPANRPVPAAEIDHHSEQGYPEDAGGLLVTRKDREGWMVDMEGDPYGNLLYAQFADRQRDAVLFARRGPLFDVLPDGSAHTVPYGYGAIRMNTVIVSEVEAVRVPHFSDNVKEYRHFPLTDLYVGGTAGLTGVTLDLRYVHAEQYVGYLRAGINAFAPLKGLPLSTYLFPVHAGFGYRFPGPLPAVLGDTYLTIAADMLIGLGEPEGSEYDNPLFMPGVTLEIERPVYRGSPAGEDFRNDPRPFNYRMGSAALHLGLHVDLRSPAESGLLSVTAGITYRYNVLGPRIPEHAFKETREVYTSDEYRERKERERQRREARIERIKRIEQAEPADRSARAERDGRAVQSDPNRT